MRDYHNLSNAVNNMFLVDTKDFHNVLHGPADCDKPILIWQAQEIMSHTCESLASRIQHVLDMRPNCKTCLVVLDTVDTPKLPILSRMFTSKVRFITQHTYMLYCYHAHNYFDVKPKSKATRSSELYCTMGKFSKMHRVVLFDALISGGFLEEGKAEWSAMFPEEGTQYMQDIKHEMSQVSHSLSIDKFKPYTRTMDQDSKYHVSGQFYHSMGIPYDPERYEKTGIAIVSETEWDARDFPNTNGAWITEKTYRPIMNHMPFMLVNQGNQTYQLKSMGFKTFEDMYDDQSTRWSEIKNIMNPDNYKAYKEIIDLIAEKIKVFQHNVMNDFSEIIHRTEYNSNHLALLTQEAIRDNPLKHATIDDETYEKSVMHSLSQPPFNGYDILKNAS